MSSRKYCYQFSWDSDAVGESAGTVSGNKITPASSSQYLRGSYDYRYPAISLVNFTFNAPELTTTAPFGMNLDTCSFFSPDDGMQPKREHFPQSFCLASRDIEALKVIATVSVEVAHLEEFSMLHRISQGPKYSEYFSLLSGINCKQKYFYGEVEADKIKCEDKMSRLKLAYFLKLHHLFENKERKARCWSSWKQ